jgi:hypothetical protein
MTWTLFVLAVALAAACPIWRSPAFRQRRARRRKRNDWRRRHLRRQFQLDLAGVASDELVALSEAAEVVATTANDPFDIEPLFDRYVELAIARRRCQAAVRGNNVAWLAARAEAIALRQPKVAGLLQRRIAQTCEAADRLAALDDSLGAVSDLIRYYAERAAMSADDEPFDEVVAVVLSRFDAESEHALAS